MNDLIALIILGLLCMGQAVERFFYAKEMNKQLGEATRAVLSRNISEFLAATTPPKKVTEIKGESDVVELSSLNDDDFENVMKKV